MPGNDQIFEEVIRRSPHNFRMSTFSGRTGQLDLGISRPVRVYGRSRAAGNPARCSPTGEKVCARTGNWCELRSQVLLFFCGYRSESNFFWGSRSSCPQSPAEKVKGGVRKLLTCAPWAKMPWPANKMSENLVRKQSIYPQKTAWLCGRCRLFVGRISLKSARILTISCVLIWAYIIIWALNSLVAHVAL